MDGTFPLRSKLCRAGDGIISRSDIPFDLRSHFAESLKRVIGASRRPRLQVSLLVEHEVTRILQVTRALAERMGIEFPADHEIKELEQDVEPSGVLDTHLFFEEPKLLLQHGSGAEVFLSWKFQKQSKNDYC
jgi:hypothetical protein